MKSIRKIVASFEGNSGFDAIRYRGLHRCSSLAQKIEAVKSDIKWLRDNTEDACQRAEHDIGDLELYLENRNEMKP